MATLCSETCRSYAALQRVRKGQTVSEAPSREMTRDEARRYWSENRFPELANVALVEKALNRITTKMTAEIFVRIGNLGADTKVLDVGCGWGRILFAMARMFPSAQFSGIDVNPEVLAEGRRLAEKWGVSNRVSFSVMELESLEFADSTFDLVCSSRVFQYVPDKLKGARECRRVLRTGGILAIAIPNKLSPVRSSYHVPLYDPSEVCGWLINAGFSGVRHGYYGFSRASGRLTAKLARLLELARFVPIVARIGAFVWACGTK